MVLTALYEREVFIDGKSILYLIRNSLGGQGYILHKMKCVALTLSLLSNQNR